MVVGNRYLKCNHVIQILDIDGGTDIVETHIKPMTLDLLRVEAYEKSYESDDQPELYTDVVMQSGQAFCIDVDYAEFDRLFTKHVINVPRFFLTNN